MDSIRCRLARGISVVELRNIGERIGLLVVTSIIEDYLEDFGLGLSLCVKNSENLKGFTVGCG